MKLLVCSRLSIPARQLYLPDWEYAKSIGHEVTIQDRFSNNQEVPDAIILMGIGALQCAMDAVRYNPKTPFYVYNWDCYKWVWDNPRPNEYDYNAYGELIKHATEVWVPSVCTGKRTVEWWGSVNWKTIRCNCPWWESTTKDDGYILYPLRQIPDPAWGRFERACTDLGIPYVMSLHRLSYPLYQQKVANCRFIVSDLYEMSTGGLSLLEGYYLGKPCLLTNSKWHGGSDYFGGRATYFEHSNFMGYKDRLWEMFINPPKVAEDHKEFITKNFSSERVIEEMLERVNLCQMN